MATEARACNYATQTIYSTGGETWANPSNVFSNDGAYASVTWYTVLGQPSFTDWLECDFPAFTNQTADDTIDEVRVYVEWKNEYSDLNSIDTEIQFYNGSSWCSGHVLGDPINTTEAYDTVACSHFTWDYLNVDSLKVRIRLYNAPTTSNEKSYIDYVYAQVTYSLTHQVSIGDIGLSVVDYRILEQTPLKQLVRVWMVSYGDKTDVYNLTAHRNGISFIYDLIIESGKHGMTIIPRHNYHDKYGLHMLSSMFGGASYNVSILGYAEVKIAGLVNTKGISDPASVPIILMLRKNSNVISGIASNKMIRSISNDDSSNTFIAYSGFDQIDDDYNSKLQLYAFFSNAFYDANGNDLQLFYEAEDDPLVSGASTTVNTDISASGGSNLSTTDYIYVDYPPLEKGSYLAIVRVRQEYGTDSLKVIVRKGASTDYESYGYNHGYNSDIASTGDSGWHDIIVPFTSVNTSDDYRVYVYSNSGTIFVDFFMLIPLSNGKTFMHDLYEQQIVINNNKYIGLL